MLTNSVHLALKEATASWHGQVDEAYSAFDLSSPDGYARFLWAHRIAAVNYQQWFDYFAIRLCAETAPDYSEMLFADLQGLSQHTPALPSPHQPWNSRVLSTSFLLGLGYTICGSRLGVAALHRAWGQTEFGLCHNGRARFLSDRMGLNLWHKLMQWCVQASLTPLEQQEACEASMETFSLFLSAAHFANGMVCHPHIMEKSHAG